MVNEFVEKYYGFTKRDEVRTGNYESSYIIMDNSVGHYIDILFTTGIDFDFCRPQPRRVLKFGPMSKEVFLLLWMFVHPIVMISSNSSVDDFIEYMKDNHLFDIWHNTYKYIGDNKENIDVDKLKSYGLTDDIISMYQNDNILKQIEEVGFMWLYGKDYYYDGEGIYYKEYDKLVPLHPFIITTYCIDEDGFHHLN